MPGQAQVVDRAVLEPRCGRRPTCCRGSATDATPMLPPANHGRRSRAERLVAGDERADARRVAEHLVPGDRDEVGPPAVEVEAVRRHERRRVEQDVPAALVGGVDPGERMADAGVVGLRRVGEQARASGAARSRASSDRRVVRRAGRASRAGRTRPPRPRARANSRMPLTELWLSAVRSRRLPGSNGYDSPTSLSAAVALAVKMTSYSSGEALKNARIAGPRRVREAASRPPTPGCPSAGCRRRRDAAGAGARRSCDSRVEPAARVVEVDLVLARRAGAYSRSRRASTASASQSGSAAGGELRAEDVASPGST